MSSPAPGSHPRHHIPFSHYVSLSSSPLWQFLGPSFPLRTSMVLRSSSQVFCRLLLNCFFFPDVSLIISLAWSYGFIGRPQRKSASFIPSYQEYILLTWHHCWCWLGPPGCSSVCQILHWKVAFSPFPMM